MTRVLVFGPPRSGTSCVAGVLHRLGVSMGDRFQPPDPMNPVGFYADLDFEEALADWYDMDRLPGPTVPSGLGTRLAALVADRDARGGDWGVKVTFGAAVLPAMLAAGPVLAVLAGRPPAASEASLAAHTLHPQQDIRRLLGWCDAAAREVEAAGVPCLRVGFDALLADPAAGVGELAAFVGRPTNPDAVGFVAPSLRRF